MTPELLPLYDLALAAHYALWELSLGAKLGLTVMAFGVYCFVAYSWRSYDD